MILDTGQIARVLCKNVSVVIRPLYIRLVYIYTRIIPQREGLQIFVCIYVRLRLTLHCTRISSLRDNLQIYRFLCTYMHMYVTSKRMIHVYMLM